jgi:HD-GYP domain-containing protein (c-di-GMP phosphodiesterase class II)
MKPSLGDRLKEKIFFTANKTPDQQRTIFFRRILTALIVIVLSVAVVHLVMYLIYQDLEFAFFLVGDLITLLVCLAVWEFQLNRRSRFASIILLVATTILITVSFPIDILDRVLLLYSVPIILASFIITPASSFIFALLATFGYSLFFFLRPLGMDYNYIAILFLFFMAMMSWLVARMMDRSYRALSVAYDETIQNWRKTLDQRTQPEEGHLQEPLDLTLKLAKVMKIPEKEFDFLRRGVLLHDIGKMSIPDRILLKKGKLTDWEWEVMRMYPTYAYQWMSSIDYLKPALDIPHYHRERWDGTGYPEGLKGEKIPLAARIFAVVNVWTALRSERPYRPAWSDEEAKKYISQQAGKEFDPQVVEEFMKLV